MTDFEARSRVKARVWQAIAQSGLNLSDVPQEKVNQLVDVSVDAALLEIDAYLKESLEADKKQATAAKVVASGAGVDPYDPDPLKEDLLWEGRPLLSITTRYVITDERLRIIEGLLGKTREDVELIRIQDVDQKQNLSERLLNIGDITIRSHDRSHPVIILRNVTDPEHVHEVLRRAVLNARKKHGLTYREEM